MKGSWPLIERASERDAVAGNQQQEAIVEARFSDRHSAPMSIFTFFS